MQIGTQHALYCLNCWVLEFYVSKEVNEPKESTDDRVVVVIIMAY